MNEQEMEKYFEENAVDGELSPEKTEALLQAAMGGDVEAATTGDTESGDAPDPVEAKVEPEQPETPEPKEEEAKEPEPEEKAAEPEAEPVIVARDGKNTIPYSELTSAREEAKAERSQREALERELAEIKARLDKEQGEADGDEPEAKAESDPLAKLREDWPEVADVVDGALAKERERVKALEAQVAQLSPTTEQLAAERAAAAHFNAITKAHPDAETIVNSREFADWQAGQPGFMRQIFEHVINKGTTEQVIELLDGFKVANPNWGKDASASDNAAKKDPAARQEAVKAAKEKAAEKSSAPKSLSDIPGGEAAPTDTAEAFMQRSPEAQLEAMLKMSPDKREELMRRLT